MVAASVTSTTPAGIARKNAKVCSQPRIRGLPMSTGRSRRAPTSDVEASEGLLTHARIRAGKLPEASNRAMPRQVPAAPPVRLPATPIRPAGAVALLIDLAEDARR